MQPEKFLRHLAEGQTSSFAVACFGSRETPPEVLNLMAFLGRVIVACGHWVVSGHADGADQAFARGATEEHPDLVHICLPWKGYNRERPIHIESKITVLADLPSVQRERYFQQAAQHHPAWNRLSQPVRLLHGRNELITENAWLGICYLNHQKPGGGGSGQAFRSLTSCGVPVVDLADFKVYNEWVAYFSPLWLSPAESR